MCVLHRCTFFLFRSRPQFLCDLWKCRHAWYWRQWPEEPLGSGNSRGTCKVASRRLGWRELLGCSVRSVTVAGWEISHCTPRRRISSVCKETRTGRAPLPRVPSRAALYRVIHSDRTLNCVTVHHAELLQWRRILTIPCTLQHWHCAFPHACSFLQPLMLTGRFVNLELPVGLRLQAEGHQFQHFI
jgi:hypothetical protein